MKFKWFIQTSLFALLLIGSNTAFAKVNITTYFASWCATCANEIEFFNQLLAENAQNVSINGICVDRDKKEGEKFVEKYKPNYPVRYDTAKDLPKLPIIEITGHDGSSKRFDAFNESVKSSIKDMVNQGSKGGKGK